MSWLEFHMAHEFTCTFQQVLGVRQFSAQKESDIDMGRESIDIAERCLANACSRVTIMKQLSNIITTDTHDIEPLPCD